MPQAALRQARRKSRSVTAAIGTPRLRRQVVGHTSPKTMMAAAPTRRPLLFRGHTGERRKRCRRRHSPFHRDADKSARRRMRGAR